MAAEAKPKDRHYWAQKFYKNENNDDKGAAGPAHPAKHTKKKIVKVVKRDQGNVRDAPRQDRKGSKGFGEGKGKSRGKGTTGKASSGNLIDDSISQISASSEVWTIVNAIKDAAEAAFGHGVRAFPFGSSANGFATSSSDVDVAMRVPYKEPKTVLTDREFWKALERRGFSHVQSILRAKIPIVKYTFERRNGIPREVDLSCGNTLPLFNTLLLGKYAKMCPEVSRLAAEVRAWAKEYKIHGSNQGLLSSYGFNLMTIFYMQICGILPSLQADCDARYFEDESKKRYDVSMASLEHIPVLTPEQYQQAEDLTLEDFITFYLRDYRPDCVVSIRVGRLDAPGMEFQRLAPRKDSKTFIRIEDPMDLSRDVGSAVSRVDHFWDGFDDAARNFDIDLRGG